MSSMSVALCAHAEEFWLCARTDGDNDDADDGEGEETEAAAAAAWAQGEGVGDEKGENIEGY